MKTKEELYHKVYLTPRLPRVDSKRIRTAVNKINKNKTQEHLVTKPSGSQSSETWCNNVDYRIPGIPLSAVEQLDTTRKVKRLIQQFESDPKSFL